MPFCNLFMGRPSYLPSYLSSYLRQDFNHKRLKRQLKTVLSWELTDHGEWWTACLFTPWKHFYLLTYFVVVVVFHCWRSETAERRTSSLQLFLLSCTPSESCQSSLLS